MDLYCKTFNMFLYIGLEFKAYFSLLITLIKNESTINVTTIS